MDCKEARERLIDHGRGRLDAATSASVVAHLQGCAGCRNTAAAEDELSALLGETLPRQPASARLKERLAAQLASAPAPASASVSVSAPRRARRWVAPLVAALAAAALVLLAVRWSQPAFLRDGTPGRAEMIAEGVDDHLRVVASAHPVEIESGGIHQVKPWFTGRLDFAPPVSFSGDDEFQLAGGAVGYFRDRKAAVFVWKHKLHTLSLFVFRGDGLRWPTRGLRRVGAVEVDAAESRGFHVLLWRAGDLGYCLVSDVDGEALVALAGRIAAAR
jgi:anti-sigma factor RsiW